MARFLFIWTIMIGAMIGVRESTHFEVDVLPQLSRRGEAVARLLGRLGVLAAAIMFVWAGIQFTKFAWNRTSELAELPLWLIHVAWPVTGLTWIVFLGEQIRRRPQDHSREISMTGAVLSPGVAALILFGLFFLLDVHARAGGLRARPGLPADPGHRATARHDVADAGDLQRLQLLHPAGGAVLPADRQPDERRRHHRPADEAVAHHGRAFPGRPGADQRRAVDLLCRHLRLLDRRRGEPVQDLHRGADQGRLRPVLLGGHHGRLRRAGRDHSAVDPDDRVGRHPHRLDRRAVPCRHHPGPADRPRADGDRARLCQGARLSDLPALDLARVPLLPRGSRSRP